MKKTDTRRGFTLIEILTVFALITILVGLLMPAISAVMNSARRTQAATEIAQIKAALEEYKSIWQEYPPDYVGDPAAWNANTFSEWDSGRCLVFYLGTKFEAGAPHNVAPWGENVEFVSTKSFGPLYEFPADRLHQGHFLDPWGHEEEYPDNYYRFDDNTHFVEADGDYEGNLAFPGGYVATNYREDPPEEDDYPDADPAEEALTAAGASGENNWNATNLNHEGVDIWSRGDTEGRVSVDEFIMWNWEYIESAGGSSAYFDDREELMDILQERSQAVHSSSSGGM